MQKPTKTKLKIKKKKLYICSLKFLKTFKRKFFPFCYLRKTNFFLSLSLFLLTRPLSCSCNCQSDEQSVFCTLSLHIIEFVGCQWVTKTNSKHYGDEIDDGKNKLKTNWVIYKKFFCKNEKH